ncbi:MAG: DUF3089 domain-containing protein, partial [Pseudomonadota bacterium]
MARKFLYLIAIVIVLYLVARIAYEMFADEIAAVALVPSAEFTPTDPLEANAYQDPALWYSRPGIGVNDPARWQPALADAASEDGEISPTSRPVDPQGEELGITSDVPDFAVFFIHPTSYLNRDNWNAPIGDEEAERIARIYIRGMASPFNAADEIWAPRYRQATMGAFLTDAPEGDQALDAAYADVLEAFRFFVDSVSEDMPIVLAGHSQGSVHLLRLLREEVKEKELGARIVAAYAIGWPVSVAHDLPALGVPACATAAQTGCLLSWSSYAEPADPSSVIDTYSASIGFDGEARGTSQILCTNPLLGTFGGTAEASA